jgi:aryl-alcohol dehydrogenase-like predicted oxidoreductase
MADFCAANGIGLLCDGAVAGGCLSSRYVRAADPAAPLENRSLVKYRLIIEAFGGWDRFQQMLAALETIAMRHGVGVGSVAIRWVLDQPGVSGATSSGPHGEVYALERGKGGPHASVMRYTLNRAPH